VSREMLIDYFDRLLVSGRRPGIFPEEGILRVQTLRRYVLRF
jgi:hypothetical protein